MDVISLSAIKEDIFDFTLDIQGLDSLDGLRVQLIIQCNDVGYSFNCVREGSENKFTVKVPPLTHIERTAYPYRIEVVAEGYHFIPMTGTANFTKDPFVTMHNKPEIRTEVTPPVQRPVQEHRKTTRPQEKSVRQLAEEAMQKMKKKDSKPEDVKKIAEKIVKTEKPAMVKEEVDDVSVTSKIDREKEEKLRSVLDQFKNQSSSTKPAKAGLIKH